MSRFSSEVIKLAQESEKKYGVPASVTLAQYALESGYGTSAIATKANNYFGMRYYGSGSNYYANSNGRWQKFNNISESFDAHGKLLAGDLYAPHTKSASNVDQYIDAIAEIYAPSSDGNNDYAKNLKRIIADNNLTQYDSMYKTGVLDTTKDILSDVAETGIVTGVKDASLNLLGNVIKALSIIGICVLAFILIMKAFNVPISKKDIAKKVIGKVTEKAEEESDD